MPKNTYKLHVKIIDYMLHRKFPEAAFEVSFRKHVYQAKGGFKTWDRWIEIAYYGNDEGCPSRKEIEYYLKRFQNEKDRHGNTFARSFWANAKGRARLAIIRKKYRTGGSTIEERYEAPETGGPYSLARFEVQEYRLVNRDDKPYTTYKDDDD